jgi:hypothetical protein
MQNNLRISESRKAKRLKQDRQNGVKSCMPQGGED